MIEPIGLSWTIRTSFLRYIAGMPDGRGVLAGGAIETAGRGITFPPAGAHFDETSGNGAIRFGGEVTFSGHFGMLTMRLADPWIDTADGTGTLFVAARSGDEDGFAPFATFAFDFEATEDAYVWRACNVQLLAHGATLFGDVYPEGEPLDPFIAVLDRRADASAPAQPG
ncbi:MAG TPA: HtaA domain-containing protein [Solirubrobacteraceae bacterium]|nr:HtaA domain-containing protein [Solirubrobacteraceae bacterium]